MKQLCIIPCGTKKIWDKQGDIGPAKAKNAYIGTFHKLCESYAEAFFDRWVILSAKYGLLDADDVVAGPYDVTFNTKSKEIITIEQLKKQLREKSLEEYEHIVVLTGKKYKKVIEQTFVGEYKIEFPLQGCTGIGYMQKMLKSAVNERSPIHNVK